MIRMIFISRVCCAATLFLSMSCAVGPDYHAPELDVPENFQQQPAIAENGDRDLASWWKTFNDPTLNALIEKAIAQNLDLQIAELRVRESRALLRASYSLLFPTFDTSASFNRSKNSKNAGSSNNQNSVTDTTGETTTGIQSSNSTTPKNLYAAGFDSSWEIDIFGASRRQIESYSASYEAQLEAKRNSMVTLLAEVAANYVILRGLQHQTDITQQNIDAERETLEIQRERLEAGITSDLTVAQAEAQLANIASQLPSLSSQIQQTIHRLSILLGQNPASLTETLSVPSTAPVGPAVVPAGLPSDLVRRRPDVRQAERVLAAATANIGVATADLFPKFTLTGTFGVKSEEFGSLFGPNSQYWSFGPKATLPILSLNPILQNIKIQNTRQQEALLAYQRAVLDSLADVENALVAHDREQKRQELLQRSVEANRRAFNLAKQLNDAGVVDFLNVLAAQRALFEAEDQLARSEQTVSTNLIALYKALGGGWEVAEEMRGEEALDK